MVLVGVDLGGTKIAAGIVNDEGVIIAKDSRLTLAERPFEAIVADIAACIEGALTKAGKTAEDVASIGIGIPGIGDNETGRVVFCTNLGWHDIPLREELQRYINKPIYIDNDATVAGFAEASVGVSKGLKCSVFLTLGTGVGGGIVIDGKPWQGAHGVASELGHLVVEIDGIPCTCGKSGCLERYASATALIRMGREVVGMHPDSALMDACEGDPKKITAKMIIDLAKEGDDIALRLFNRYAKYVAIAVNNVTSFLDPEMVVLGGGISHAGQFLLDAVKSKIPHYLMYKTLPHPEVTLATLGNDAGIIGAAMVGRLAK